MPTYYVLFSIHFCNFPKNVLFVIIYSNLSLNHFSFTLLITAFFNKHRWCAWVCGYCLLSCKRSSKKKIGKPEFGCSRLRKWVYCIFTINSFLLSPTVLQNHNHACVYLFSELCNFLKWSVHVLHTSEKVLKNHL